MNRLDLEGELAFEVEGESLALRADGSRADIEVGGMDGARRVLRSLPSRGTRRSALRRAESFLRKADVEVAFYIGAHEVGRLGRGASPGIVSRLLALDPVAFQWPALWRAWRSG